MSTRSVSRRRFLMMAGISLGASVLACGGLTAWGLTPQQGTRAEAHLGDGTASRRILVAYATRCASTADVAMAIGAELHAAGAAVDVLPAKSVSGRQLAEGIYTGLVVGSAARMGALLPEAISLLEKNRASLTGLPVAYFQCCYTMREDTQANRSTAAAYFQPLRNAIEPVAEGLFAGKIDYTRLEPALHLALSIGRAPEFSEGDWRNWDAIQAWTRGLAPVLVGKA